MADIPIAHIIGEQIITDDSDSARELHTKNRYGSMRKGGTVELSVLDTLHLVQRDRLIVYDGRKQQRDAQQLLQRFSRRSRQLSTRLAVFSDLRDRGYIVKTALKFGAEFRVYDKGVKPGQDHAKWVVYPVKESDTLTWHGFSAKNRVAHSTKKRLLIGIVDDEMDVTYYEVRWMRP